MLIDYPEQIINDLMYLDKTVGHQTDATRAAKRYLKKYSKLLNRFSYSQFMSHLLGTLIQAWCLSIVWRLCGNSHYLCCLISLS